MKKLISWNVNGIRACVKKGFLDFFNEVDADIFCIQESKMEEGAYAWWSYCFSARANNRCKS